MQCVHFRVKWRMASEKSLDASVSTNQQKISVWDMMLPGNWDVSRLRVQPSRITTKRILASTTLLAISLGMMKILTSSFAAVFVFPLWGTAIGCLIAGSAGAKRGGFCLLCCPPTLQSSFPLVFLLLPFTLFCTKLSWASKLSGRKSCLAASSPESSTSR